jgi:carbonic anhydrase
LRELDQGLQRFLEGQSRHPHCSAERLRNLVTGQHPIAAFLSCADSRVPIELLFDAGFGDLFVVRNAGNTCNGASIASLEYAIEAHDISLILVMGHEGCGAVTSACQPHGSLTPSLHTLLRTIGEGLDEVGGGGDHATAFARTPSSRPGTCCGGAH